ncbi:MAG: cytochrome b/b6 domain-containing protein [Phycisphaerae bacterium]|nr:cytochrome b/b6 domain-containing protein [Phycisphaerae bacterium]
MSKTLVWDIPTRLFHGVFAAGFIAAAVISLLLGDDHPLFPYHAILGLAISLMVLLRVVWGLVGTRYARFSNFAFGPAAVGQYMKSALFGGGQRYIGHNPGSAYAIFAMLALMIGLAITGIMLGRGNEGVKETHELLAYAMVVVVITHVAGVVLHMIRHRENIVASMIHGRKRADPAEAIRSSHPALACASLAVVAAWSFDLVRNFDPTTHTTRLPLLGTTLQMGEAEHETAGDHPSENNERHDDDD